jgi:tetratricopeptide (TPR) repeat protein
LSFARDLPAGLGLILALGGCAGGQVYDNGINHVYLCAVRVVRAHGYQMRQQEFKKKSGKMVAARSVPDPQATPMRRGLFRRAAEVIANAIEHSKLEFWDEELARTRIRTDKRVVTKFKARRGGFLGLGSRNRTRVEFSIDSTDYGREDWVIHRERLSAGGREGLYQALANCLGGGRIKPAPLEVAAALSPSAAPQATAAESLILKPSKEKTPAASPLAEPKPAVEPTPSALAPAVPIRLTPEELEEKLEKGRKAYEAGNYSQTVELLEVAIQSDPRNAEALGYLGAAHYQLGQFAESIGMYGRYLEVVPSDLRTQEFLEEIKKRAAAGK